MNSRAIFSRIAAIMLLTVPSAAYAQETMIACEESSRFVRDGRSDSPTPAVTRYYLLNDATRSFSVMENGIPKPYCGVPSECEVTYTNTMISFVWSGAGAGNETRGRIDRVSGRVTVTNNFRGGERGPIRIETTGQCRPVTERRF